MPIGGSAAHGRKFTEATMDAIHSFTLSHSSSVVPHLIAVFAHHNSSACALRWQIGNVGAVTFLGTCGATNVCKARRLTTRTRLPFSPARIVIRSASSNLWRRSFSFQAGEQRLALNHWSASQASALDRPKRKHSQATRRVALWPPIPLTAGGSFSK